MRKRVIALGVIGLLGLYAILSLTASAQKGLSYDEGEEIAVGYDLWLHRDFRMESANGDLIKRWAALPLLFSHPHFPSVSDPDWRGGASYRLGFKFFFESGNRPESLLLQTRSLEVALGIATGLMVFFCSRAIFGGMGGLISLALFSFSAHMLAFGAIVSTEMSICLTLLGATWSIWRLLHRISWLRLLGSLAWIGLLFLAKASALLIFPIAAVLVLAKLASRRALEWRLGAARTIASRHVQARIFLVLAALHGLAAWGAIWAHYDFRYAASPNPSVPGIVFHAQESIDPIAPSELAFLDWCRRAHFLPEGYLHGIQWLLGENDWRVSFMNGRWRVGGWNSFFPYAFWAKTSPALLGLLGLGLWGWRRLRRGQGPRAPAFYEAIPLIALIAVYAAAAIVQHIDIGHRHILPIYPPLFVLAGSAAMLAPLGSRVLRWAVPALLIGYAANGLAAYPDYLAYFNPAMGGSAEGYRHLVDSSLDWGMDLPGLKRWLDAHDPGNRQPVYLAYFGTDSPEYYHIRYRWLPSDPDWRPHQALPLQPGIYAISATLLQSVGTRTFGPWGRTYESAYQSYLRTLRVVNSNPDLRKVGGLSRDQSEELDALCFGRLCAWLRLHRKPDADAGHSILIWKLDGGDLNRALFGPSSDVMDLPAD